MKRKFLQLTTLFLAVVLTAICFTACGIYTNTVVATLDYKTEDAIVMTVTTTDGKATAFDALKYLQDKGQITFTYEDSTYGAFITAINGKENVVTESTQNSSKGASWMFYTSDKENAYEETTTEINGVTYYSCAFGASGLVVKEGETYVWVYETYEYTW